MSLNALCPYYTMFPEDFPRRHIARRRSGWVLDPFCGRGTTAYVARSLGVPSVSIDVSPVATTIARAKMVKVSGAAVAERAKLLLSRGEPDPTPVGTFWRWAYHPDTLHELLVLRRSLSRPRTPEDVALRGLVLGALHGPLTKTTASYFSNQMPRTFAPKPKYSARYWRDRNMKPPRVSAIDVIAHRAQRFFDNDLPNVEGVVLRADARSLPDTGVRFSTIITSPPYFGMTTYIPDQWLRNWFVGGPAEVVYAGDEQLSRGTVDDFTAGLASVWQRVAELSKDKAALIIRFGALRSIQSDPRDVIRNSIRDAGSGWRIRYVGDAGAASGRGRQANHMGEQAARAKAVEELDVVATLER